MSRRSARIALVAALGIACGEPTGSTSRLVAQERWARQGPSSYSITIRSSCGECDTEFRPVIVTVSHGVVESRVVASTGEAVPERFHGTFPSVPGLFAIIAEARRQRPERLDVTYDPKYGYPTRIVVDHEIEVADDGFSVFASDLVVR